MTEIKIYEKMDELTAMVEARKSITQNRVNDALALAVSTDSLTEMRGIRAELNREFKEFEARRIEIKKEFAEPWTAFEALYKSCVTDIYKTADKQLAEKIGEAEFSLKIDRDLALGRYFEEYRTFLGIPEEIASYRECPVKVTLSATDSKLRREVKGYLDRIAEDISTIEAMTDRAEIMAEYKRNHSLTYAITTVQSRKEAVEAAEKAIREKKPTSAREVADRFRTEFVTPPKNLDDISVVVRMSGTDDQIVEAKMMLDSIGIKWEVL